MRTNSIFIICVIFLLSSCSRSESFFVYDIKQTGKVRHKFNLKEKTSISIDVKSNINYFMDSLSDEGIIVSTEFIISVLRDLDSTFIYYDTLDVGLAQCDNYENQIYDGYNKIKCEFSALESLEVNKASLYTFEFKLIPKKNQIVNEFEINIIKNN